MPKSLKDIDPSRGIYRIGFRLPITLYHLRLGWLLGDRFLMLTTSGRKSGKPHRTVIEVVYHDRQSGEYTIASGWGTQSDWYKNLKHNPKVWVQVRLQQFQAIAQELASDEAEKLLLEYAHRHPLAFRELARLMSGSVGENVAETCHAVAQEIPLITLIPNPIEGGK
jgi:deazaflavin-dependent oxidoreductase (nitroreductase family)